MAICNSQDKLLLHCTRHHVTHYPIELWRRIQARIYINLNPSKATIYEDGCFRVVVSAHG